MHIRTRNGVFEACPMSLELDHLDCSSKDPSSPSSSSSQAHPEFFHLCYYYKVPCIRTWFSTGNWKMKQRTNSLVQSHYT